MTGRFKTGRYVPGGVGRLVVGAAEPVELRDSITMHVMAH